MQIDQGLFKLDIVDHHAVLGISMEADPKQVRKRYLKVARKLHPDSLLNASDADKQRASELLSKLVNPAYEVLSQERLTVEHRVLLKLKGQQLKRQPVLLSVTSERARALATSNNLEYDYPTALQALAEGQYDNLETVLDWIGEISQLNAVYLMAKGDLGASAPAASLPSLESEAPADNAAATTAEAPMTSQARRELVIDSYLNRAKAFEYKQEYSRAIVELREAIKANPNNARCHGQLASVYLKAKQMKMASIHCKRALELDANDPMGKEVDQKLSAQNQRTKAARQQSGKSEGGLFGGLFGGKKR
jgi:curved DNA-binding protein CbpA